jgi:hypothetical protein
MRISCEEAYRLLSLKEGKPAVVLYTLVQDERHPLVQLLSTLTATKTEDIFLGGLFLFDTEIEAERFFSPFRDISSDKFYAKKMIKGVVTENNLKLRSLQ